MRATLAEVAALQNGATLVAIYLAMTATRLATETAAAIVAPVISIRRRGAATDKGTRTTSAITMAQYLVTHAQTASTRTGPATMTARRATKERAVMKRVAS